MALKTRIHFHDMLWQEFSDLCYALIKAEYPNAKKLADVRDGGADTFIGDLTRHPKIFQCKHFPNRIRRKNIEESLKHAVENYSPKEWTLCIPKDLTAPQRMWFESLKERYSDIKMDHWGKTDLIELLEKHKEVKRHFFYDPKYEEQKRLRRDRLIVADLRNWMRKTTFANIDYYQGKIKTIEHKDPELDYLDKDKNVLEKYNAYLHWESGKRASERPKDDGVNAIRDFHRKIEKALENILLKKSMRIGRLLEPYYSFPRICQAIFEGGELALSIKLDSKSEKFSVESDNSKTQRVTGFLSSGVVTLAWGDVEILTTLQRMIKNLNENDSIRKEIDTYTECKRKLDSREPFREFEIKLQKIIADFRWNQEFMP